MKEALIRKLNLGKYERIALYNTNPHSPELDLVITDKDLVDLNQTYDIIFSHVFAVDEMKEVLDRFWDHHSLNQGGLAYLVYPKMNNDYYPGIHRDSIFPALEVDDALGLLPGTHYKFNKMVSLNEIFTIIGIKYLSDKELTKLQKPNSNQTSGRVSDYVQYIPEIIQNLLEKSNDLSETFKQLTPGKQRGWAREIYSAKTQATREKRFDKLIAELEGNLK